MLGFPLVGSEETEVEEGHAGLEQNVSQNRFMSSEILPSDKVVLHASSSGSREKRIRVPDDAEISLLEALTKCTDTRFAVSLKSGKVWRCFPGAVPYACDIPEARDTSSVRHATGRCHPFVRCKIRTENMVHGGKSPSRLLAATSEMQRQVQSLKDMAKMVSE